MADNGLIKTIYSDSNRTQAIYPRTTLNAVSGINGETWQEALDAKANQSTTYTKTEVDTAIATAIGDAIEGSY